MTAAVSRLEEQNRAIPFEKHYTPQEVAEKWNVDESTVRRIFQDLEGVLKIGRSGAFLEWLNGC